MVDSSRSLLPQSIIAAGHLTRRESRPVTISTQAFDWPGVLVEAGRNDIAQADDAVTPNHYLALNVDTTPITMEVKEPHGFKKIVVPPQTFWLNPGSAPVTLRTENRNAYVRVALDPLGEIAKAFGDVRLTPTTIVIDKRGEMVLRITGEPDFARLHALLEEKLKEPA